MKTSRLCWAIVLVIFVVAPAFSAGEGEAGEEEVTLRVWDRVAEMETVVDMFNDAQEEAGGNVRAEFELIPYDQQVPQFTSALASGTAPDVYSLDLVQYPYFVEIGAFADMSEDFETLSFRDSLPEGILELGRHEGGVYGIPYEVDLSHILWNKDMFREAGLDPDQPPRTWDELIEFSQALTVDHDDDGNIDQWGTAVGADSAGAYMFWFMPFIWGNEGRMFDENGNVVLDSEESREALQLWHDLIHEYEVAPESGIQWGGSDRYNAFVAEQLAIYLGGNFNIIPLSEDAPDLDYGVSLIPSGRGSRATFGGGNLIGISSQSEHYDEAWEFVEFALSEEALLEAYASQLALIPRADLYDNEYYAEVPVMNEYSDFLEAAVTPKTTRYNEIYEPVLFYFEGALNGDISVDEAIEEASRAIQEAVADE